MKRIRIETDRLILREYEWSDLHRHHTLISDADIMYYIQDVYSRSLPESRENLRQALLSMRQTPRTQVFLVIETKQGDYVGGIGYTVTEQSPAGKRAEIGYFTYPVFQGRGYVSEAFRALMRYAFCEDGVYKISGTCVTDNMRSARVMERCGMRAEGIRRDHDWHVDSLKSRSYYGLLKQEWIEERKEEHVERTTGDFTETKHKKI